LEIARWEIQDNKTLAQLLATEQPQIAYAWSSLQLFASLHLTLRRSGIPLVYNVQDLWLPRQLEAAEQRRRLWLGPGSNPVRDAAKRLVRVWLSHRDTSWLAPLALADIPLESAIFCSAFQRARHVAAGVRIERHCVIPNGLDARFSGEPASIAGGPLRLLFASRLVVEKGAHLAVEATAEL
jgi:hypothetical protein